MVSQKIGQVNFTCSNDKIRSAIVVPNDILYMPEAEVNLISQGQIHRKRLYFLTTVDDEICIVNSRVFAYFIQNHLYIMDMTEYSAFAFTFINKEILQTWHSKLSHEDNKISLS